jgi:putative transposase
MKDWQSQAHVKWDCKYHVVILPKYRRKVLYGRIRRGIGQILRDLCRQKDIELVEGKAMPDHIHMLLSVPPRYSVAVTIGYLKGKSATRIHRELLKTKGTLVRPEFLGPGVLCEYRRSGRRPDPTVHPRPGVAPARSGPR